MKQIFLSMLLLVAVFARAETPPLLQAIAYHDIRHDVVANYDLDPYAVSSKSLAAHFRWLKNHGYVVVSLAEVRAASDGQRPLPDKAVLLTFDDGLRSVYTQVFPLLRQFGYSAVVSVVTSWIGTAAPMPYDHRIMTAEDFLSWEQIREMQESGLVEIASHSHDLHHGIPGNPQGNLQPAAITRMYTSDGYEDDDSYAERIAADLATSISIIRDNTGKAPTAITWPYGANNETVRQIAFQQGLSAVLTLRPEGTRFGDMLIVGRQLPLANIHTGQLAALFQPPKQAPVIRAAQVDLDYVYDPDPLAQEANLGLLLDRIKSMQITHVFLQAFADPDGNGSADALYFPNRHLPMRADLFNRTAWQLRTRSNVEVYAWMPLLGFTGPGIDPGWQVLQDRPEATVDAASEPRLSPFEPEARKLIMEIYDDLARYAHFSGIHFHDDGRMNEWEDANPAALEAYRAEFGDAFSIDAAHQDANLMQEWAGFKTRALIDFSKELASIVRKRDPDMKTSRNLFASAVLDPAAMRYLSQDFDAFLGSYDYVTLMAMPGLENAPDAQQFFASLVSKVRSHPGAFERTVFQLQTRDWRQGRVLPSRDLRNTMRWLQAQGVRNLAYYPDDFINNQPRFVDLRQGMSLAEFPQGSR